MATRVLLNYFSGLPNPSWSLGEEKSRQLIQLVQSLESLPGGRVEPRLDYRGFTIVGDPGSVLEGPVFVYNGVVALPGGALADPERKLESWLAESAGEALSPEIRNVVFGKLKH